MALIKETLLHRRPQEMGKIKIGGVGAERPTRDKKGTWRAPTKFKHFVITTRHRGPDGNFIRDEVMHALPGIGDAPTELSGFLMFHRVEDNIHTEMVHYQGKGKNGKVSSCDGETKTLCATGVSEPCARRSGSPCECKPYTRFHIQLAGTENTFGFHVFRSMGWESASNIQSTLQEIFERFGTCYQAPVKLVCYPSEDVHDKGTSTSLKVGLVLAIPIEQAIGRMVEASRALAAGKSAILQIASGVHKELAESDEKEIDDLVEEFNHRVEIVQEPSGPQAVTTAAGEPTAAPVAKGRPLPVIMGDAEPMEVSVTTTEEVVVTEEAAVTEEADDFDAGHARRRLMATLTDAGIGTKDPERKAWAKENNLPASTKDWGKAEYDRAHEILVGPTIEAVRVLVNGDEDRLRGVSLRVIGKALPEFLRDWKAILADLKPAEDEDDGSDLL